MFVELQAFVAVIEAGTFTSAAARLGLAKSIVSRRVSWLESEIGVQLFNRNTRRLHPTEMGQAFYARAKRILTDLEVARDEARGVQGGLRGTLRITAGISFGTRYVTPLIAEFMTAHPQLDVELQLDDRKLDLIGGGFDLAVRIGRLKTSSLIARALSPCRLVVCASPAYLLEHGVPGTPDALMSHACIGYANPPIVEQWLFKVGAELRPIHVKPRFVANNGDAIATAAAAGQGLAVLPTFIAGDLVRSGSLRIVLADFPIPEQGIYAVWPQSDQLSAKARTLVSHLAEALGQAPQWDEGLF